MLKAHGQFKPFPCFHLVYCAGTSEISEMDEKAAQQAGEMQQKLLGLENKGSKEVAETQPTDGMGALAGSGSDDDGLNDDLEVGGSATPKNIVGPASPAQKAHQKQPKMTDGIKNCEFYHGVVPDAEVADLLKKNGDFLLASKYGEAKKNVVCYVKWQNQIKLLEFTQSADGREVTLDRVCYKPTILELINHHQKNGMPIGNNGARLVVAVEKQAWELDPKDVITGRLLGEGAFGQVFLGSLMRHGKSTEVAIKMPRGSPGKDQEIRKRAMEEARIQRDYNHHNVVRLYGVVFTANRLCIVLEYLAGGALDSYVKTNPQCTPKIQAAFCFDVAVGMEYLHANKCLHRDMAARNCLVDLTFPCAKISDFGLSAKGTIHEMDRARPTPIRWMAPEVLKTANYTKAADIWSMAIIFWEIFKKCKELPYADKDLKQVQTSLWHNPNFHPDIDPALPRELKNIMETCWNHDPKLRPSATKIADYLACLSYRARYPATHQMNKTLKMRENASKNKPLLGKDKNKSSRSSQGSSASKGPSKSKEKKSRAKDGAESKKPGGSKQRRSKNEPIP
ncbi:unnamed protein product [Bursaphelenchus xylophilus]|uniref:Tyrosine-protein kinase n=1 Tax=Bursaphelenchus xylophilus TaxID=6326 RepID=A0A1I7SDY1_BURXY|nr:unnamed protein product [Bursaphelenchus xylophilus]CAG9100365.1 unnamed protein product [Bursaphelenchus xylophilus]